MLCEFNSKTTRNGKEQCLNPCCNGRCSASWEDLGFQVTSKEVLILVVMEDALREKPSITSIGKWEVLILVVMEDALRESWKNYLKWFWPVLILVVMEDALRDGQQQEQQQVKTVVLILVVMEDALREKYYFFNKTSIYGLNPCCNGRCSARCI